MTDLGVRINILKDVLEQKKSSLEQIYNICENEEMLSKEPNTAIKAEMLKGMALEKQNLIENVLQCDTVFQKSFGEIKDNFEANAAYYENDVRYLQTLIKQIVELDIKIRNKESVNKEVITLGRLPARPKTAAAKNYILKQYEKNNKKRQ